MTYHFSLSAARDYVANAPKEFRTGYIQDHNLDVNQAYYLAKNTWGNIPPGSLYMGYDPETHSLGVEAFKTDVLDVIRKGLEHDGLDQDIVQKAITTTSASVLIPTFIDPGFVDIVKRKTPFYAALAKRTMMGKTVNVPRRTAGVTPEFLADDGTAYTPADQTYGDINVDVKYLYATGRLTFPALKTTEEQVNLRQANIEHTYSDLIKYKELIMLRGRISAGTEGAWTNGWATVANGYDGVFKRVHEDASGNENDLLGAEAIKVTHVDTAIKTIIENGGIPDMGFCDFGTSTSLMQYARSFQRFQSNNYDLGVEAGRIMIDNLPIFGTTQLSSAATDKSLVVMDQRAAEVRTLLLDQFTEIPQTINDYMTYNWKTYETLVVKAPEWIYTAYNGL
jgi:hypothetical protein